MTATDDRRDREPAAGQAWDAAGYARHARFVADLGADTLALLAPQPGELILDVGCGDGALTERIAAAGAQVIGLDADLDQIRAARSLGLPVIAGDAHAPAFGARFDAVFSNAALHWIRDPDRALRAFAGVLRPGGRLVAEQGGHGNVAAIVTAVNAALEAAGHGDRARQPWDFPTPDLQTRRLAAAGFRTEFMALIPRPTPLPTGMAGWLTTFAGPFVDGLPAGTRRAVLDDTTRRLAPVLCDVDGNWTADYVRLRFKAVLAA